MAKEYKEIKFRIGGTIEQAVDLLLSHQEKGELVCGKFNGITLYSDTVTLNFAYQKITGKTKEELDKMYRIAIGENEVSGDESI